MRTIPEHILHFLVDGHKVSYKDGLVNFTRFGIFIRLDPEEFTYAWALKMDAKLQMLNNIRAGA